MPDPALVYTEAPKPRQSRTFLPPALTSSAVIFKYNPHQMTESSLLDTFVGRDELLSRMVAHVRGQRGASEPKHFFLHGTRGIGKTTMLLVLRREVAANPGLSAAFDIVQFSEEERRVANLPAFAIRILELLVKTRDEVQPDLAKALKAPERALEILLAAAGRTPERQVLLLLDNFDDLAIAAVAGKSRMAGGDKKERVGRMVRFLTSPHFLVIATALQSPEKNKRFPRQLCQRFDPIIELEPLDDAMTFLRKRAEKDHRRGFLESLPRLAPRIDGLNRLAAGNPRLLVFLYDCLGDRPLPDLVEVIQRTVDELTPMYQDVIDRLLTRSQAAVLEMLVANGGAGKAKEIAPLTYQDEQTVRTFLGDLCNIGLVVRADDFEPAAGVGKGPARDTVFRTHPPLFQIWYEMRHLRRERSLFLVRFFSLLTDSGEARGILGKIRSPESPKLERGFEQLMEDVVEILDPEWGCLKEKYVDELLAVGHTLADARAALDGAIAGAEGNARIGPLVVRAEVNHALGDLTSAERDLESAARIAERAGVPETRVKLEIAWSYHQAAASDYRGAAARAERAIELCAGLASANAHQIHAAALLALASAQYSFSHYRTALATGQAALKKLDENGARRLRLQATDLLGRTYQSLGHYKNATVWHEKSREWARDGQNRGGEAAALNNLGNVSALLGAYDRARKCHESSLTLQQEIGDRRGVATSLGNLGNGYWSLGTFDRAVEYHEKSLAILQEIQDRRGEARSLGNLGAVYYSLGAYERAREYHEKSLAINQEIGNRQGEASSLNNLGNVCWSLDVNGRALEYYAKALAISQEIGGRRDMAMSLNNLGNVHLSLGAYDRAREYIEKSMAINQEIRSRHGQASNFGSLGIVALAQDHAAEAIEFFREAHQLFLALGERQNIGNSATHLAQALFQLAAADFRSGAEGSAGNLLAQSLAVVNHAGAGQFLTTASQHLIIPCLQHSRDLAAQLAPFIEHLRDNEGFVGREGVLTALKALLGHYSLESSIASDPLKDLGPVESMLVREFIDQVERPRHVEARQLLQAGKAAEAQVVLESIVERSAADSEALLDLAGALIAQGELDEAESKLEEVLSYKQDHPAAFFLRAGIEQQRNRPERAIEILDDLLGRDPSFHQAYPPLAQLLRQQERFEDLAAILRGWRDVTEDRDQRDRLDVRIPEAYVLAGKIGEARASMPLEPFAPEDRQTRLHHGLLRAFLALQELDAETARREAVAILELAADLPPGQARSPHSRGLMVRATELLGEEEARFFLALSGAISQDVDPIEFADHFLSPGEFGELRERLVEEGRLAVEALRTGRVQVFRDLFRTSTRSIGPAAGLVALGDAWAELAPGQQVVLVDVLAQALNHGKPGEVRAALGALGKNFPHFDPPQRSRGLNSILELAGRSDAAMLSRELGLRVLNVLYPNLEPVERQQVRESLEQVRVEIDSPALIEFFNDTVPSVSAREPKG